ncbi:hypothetical protein GOODEAATRI_014379 [Goodea atripinnis]|uniref:Uncharacterized protein n=1 Tax=Goodea atripinnis TaxID=208336 RepID=A0ABV0P411_9TELE
MLPVPPNVAPAISLELDVDDGEVENYEVALLTLIFFILDVSCVCATSSPASSSEYSPVITSPPRVTGSIQKPTCLFKPHFCFPPSANCSNVRVGCYLNTLFFSIVSENHRNL